MSISGVNAGGSGVLGLASLSINSAANNQNSSDGSTGQIGQVSLKVSLGANAEQTEQDGLMAKLASASSSDDQSYLLSMLDSFLIADQLDQTLQEQLAETIEEADDVDVEATASGGDDTVSGEEQTQGAAGAQDGGDGDGGDDAEEKHIDVVV